MSQDAIRFCRIDSDSELVAVAEVSLFSGVYLRGWYVYKRGGQIEVLPPHKVYQDPVTGEEKVWSLLKFDSEATSRQWLERVKEEYLRWARKGGSIAE
jgi:hypothetical protein